MDSKGKYFDAAAMDRYHISGEKLDTYAHVIDEEIDSLNDDEVCLTKRNLKNYDSVDLSSFAPQKELNPKVFPNGKLNSKVRLRLMDIADDFFDTLSIGWVKPVDYILTGSIVNYNWSKFSDFDLHILIDFSEVDERTEFVKDYFDSKKKIWNDTHDNLKIYGFPVEIYVQDISETHTASGMYSLYKNKWIKHPEKNAIKAIKLDKFYIKEKAYKIILQIDDLERQYNSTDDNVKIEEIANKAKKLFDKIKGIRRESLKNGNEMSPGNLIFKVLRRIGYIGKLSKIKTDTYDKLYSIK